MLSALFPATQQAGDQAGPKPREAPGLICVHPSTAMSETEDGLVPVIYLNGLWHRKRACLTQAGKKKIIFTSVPTERLHAPAVVEFLQLIQRVKHTIAENELAAKVFSE